MAARTRRAEPGSPDRFPHCRVVWDAADEEVGVWVANGDQQDWAWRQRIEVIEAVAGRALDRARDEARGADLALDAVEVLRDPRMIMPLTIAAVVQVAAVHAGIPIPMAKLIGDAAGKLGQRLLAAEPGRGRDTGVYYVDFDYDTGTCRTQPDDPAIQKASRASRGDAVGELIGPRRDRTTRAALDSPASRQADPGTPAAPGLRRSALQDDKPVRAALADPAIAPRVSPAGSQPAKRGNRLRGATPDRKRQSRGGRGGAGDLDGP